MDQVLVRKALYHAVNPADITRHVLRAGQIPAHSLVPPGLPGYEEVQLSGYQPELARRLLAEAGYPGGEGLPEITYLYNTSEGHRAIAEVLQQQWKHELGVEVRLRNMEWRVFMAQTRTTEYQIARGGWIGDYLDPNTFLAIFRAGDGNNRTGWASAEYDHLLDEAARELDPERRMQLLGECEELLTAQDCVILPLYYYVVTNLYDASRWEGLEPDLLNFPQLKYLRPRAEES
jgi:oligopeptide transport system substrate-binding protein